ncbi:unnamed protein product [Brassica oleracea]
MASMLEFWRSLFKQSNPSTLTAADLIPNFTQPQPPPLTRDGDGINGESEGETRFSLLSPNLKYNRQSLLQHTDFKERDKPFYERCPKDQPQL